MFDRFSDPARSVMAAAREDALRLQHDFIAPEHMLLAITEEEGGAAAKLLESFEVDLAGLHDKLESQMERGTTHMTPTMLPFTNGAKRVLEHTVGEAKRLGHSRLGSAHLLLGLLHENQGVVAKTLQDANVDLETARTRV